ncbi:MAG: outer membrane lipoprotein-sorting protein [Magnetococcales bacterium]|nr:outer membrane lipoprotein-sorting protein [Magnetococcales bacterium]
MKKQIFLLTGYHFGARGRLYQAMLALFCLIGGWTASAGAMDANEILQEVDRSMASDSQEMVLRIVNRLVAKEEPPVVMAMAKRGGDRLIALVIAPDALKGVTAFRSGAEVWLRMPGKNIEMQQEGLARAFFGAGVFNNEDILHLDYHEEYKAELAREDQTNWHLELTPRHDWVPYTRLSMVVDKEFKLPRSVTQYGPGHTLIKTIRYTQMQRFGDGPMRPSLLETANPLNPGYTSTLRYGDVQNHEAPEALFSKTALAKIGSYFMREK